MKAHEPISLLVQMKMIGVGFLRYRKGKKSLTMVIGASFFLIFFFISLFSTFRDNLWNYWIKDLIGGHILVSREVSVYDFFDPLTSDQYFNYRDIYDLQPQLEKISTPVLKIGALLEKDDQNVSSLIIGVDPACICPEKFEVPISEGRIPADGEKEILLSRNAASKIDCIIGDMFIIYCITEEGYTNYDLVKLVGIFDVKEAFSYFGNYIAYMPLKVVQDLKYSDPTTSSDILVFTKNIPGLMEELHLQIVKGQYSFSLAKSISIAIEFLNYVILILIFIFLSSTMFQNIEALCLERFDEIGIYLSFGASPWWIRRIFFGELFLYTLYSSLLGLIPAMFFIWIINKSGLYAINASTELLMSSNHFVIGMPFIGAVYSFCLLFVIVIIGSLKPILISTSARNIIRLFSQRKKG